MGSPRKGRAGQFWVLWPLLLLALATGLFLLSVGGHWQAAPIPQQPAPEEQQQQQQPERRVREPPPDPHEGFSMGARAAMAAKLEAALDASPLLGVCHNRSALLPELLRDACQDQPCLWSELLVRDVDLLNAPLRALPPPPPPPEDPVAPQPPPRCAAPAGGQRPLPPGVTPRASLVLLVHGNSTAALEAGARSLLELFLTAREVDSAEYFVVHVGTAPGAQPKGVALQVGLAWGPGWVAGEGGRLGREPAAVREQHELGQHRYVTAPLCRALSPHHLSALSPLRPSTCRRRGGCSSCLASGSHCWRRLTRVRGGGRRLEQRRGSLLLSLTAQREWCSHSSRRVCCCRLAQAGCQPFSRACIAVQELLPANIFCVLLSSVPLTVTPHGSHAATLPGTMLQARRARLAGRYCSHLPAAAARDGSGPVASGRRGRAGARRGRHRGCRGAGSSRGAWVAPRPAPLHARG